MKDVGVPKNAQGATLTLGRDRFRCCAEYAGMMGKYLGVDYTV